MKKADMKTLPIFRKIPTASEIEIKHMNRVALVSVLGCLLAMIAFAVSLWILFALESVSGIVVILPVSFIAIWKSFIHHVAKMEDACRLKLALRRYLYEDYQFPKESGRGFQERMNDLEILNEWEHFQIYRDWKKETAPKPQP